MKYKANGFPLQAHTKSECPFRGVHCPAPDCSSFVYLSQLGSHLNSAHPKVRDEGTHASGNVVYACNVSKDHLPLVTAAATTTTHWPGCRFQFDGCTFMVCLEATRVDGLLHAWVYMLGGENMTKQ